MPKKRSTKKKKSTQIPYPKNQPPLNTLQAMQLAMQNHNAGNLQQAEALYRNVLQADPNHSDALHLLGVLAAQVERYDIACELIQKAISINNAVPDYYSNLGNALKDQGKLAEAISYYQQAIVLNPNDANVYYNLGNALQDQGQLAEAITAFQHALSLNPQFCQVYNNLGKALKEQKQPADAIACFQQALFLNPNDVHAHNNLGGVLKEQGNLTEAMLYIQRALALNPNNADTYNNLATIWTEQNKLDKAIECYLKALRINPNLAEVHFNYGTLLLKKGDLITGWLKYEWRFKIKTGKHPQLKQPLWEGNPLAGRRLLVHWEQGFGDIIQFVRYLPLIKGGTVILAIQSPLKQLLNGLPGVDLLIVKSYDNEPDIAYDVWIPLLSLPNLFATTLDTIPASIPYLYPDSQKVEKWRTRFESARFKIGLVWSGNPKFQYNRNRSASLAHFAPLASVQNISLFSLQKGEAAKQPIPEGMEMIPLTEELEDFSDTAAAINCLDLVISTDTAVPHLAGALGKPVWLLLHFSSDWRWLLDRNDNPWYPTMRLFRQAAPGDWASVFQQVVDALKLELQKFP